MKTKKDWRFVLTAYRRDKPHTSGNKFSIILDSNERELYFRFLGKKDVVSVHSLGNLLYKK
jgi:hypothetical protein